MQLCAITMTNPKFEGKRAATTAKEEVKYIALPTPSTALRRHEKMMKFNGDI